MVNVSISISDRATVAVVGGAVLAGAWLLLPRRSTRPTTCPGGRPARKIHTLETTLPVLGNLLDYVKHEEKLHDWFASNSIRFNGEPWQLSIPGQGVVIFVSTPDAIEEITTTQFHNFPKGEIQNEALRDLLGAGLVASDGDRWYRQRKAAVRFFTAKVLRTLMKDVMRKNIERMCDVIDEASAAGEMADLRDLFMAFTIETFMGLGLGVELECIGAKEPHPFLEGLDAASPATATRFRTKLARAWLRKTIDQALKNSVAKKQQGHDDPATIEADTKKPVRTVIELFLEYGEGLNEDDLVEFILTFVFAARDTTADTLSWLFYVVGHRPDVEQKLRAEMDERLPPGSNTTYLTTEHLKDFVYMEAVIKETLRLYPAAPYTLRTCASDTVICGDIFLRKGDMVGTPMYALARNPSVWGPDASEFRPERWIDEATGKIKQVAASKFYTFSAGPRTCVGMSLAMLELRVVVANLLQRYKFAVDPSNDGSYLVAPTLMMKHPLLVRAERVAKHNGGVVCRAAQPQRCPNGKPARKIHTLDSTLPILGNLLDYNRNEPRVHDWHTENCLRFNGEPWQLFVPGRPTLVILPFPQAIEEITVKQVEVFPKGAFQIELLRDLLGEGLVASDGERWYHQRKAAARFFTAKVLRTLMTETMQRGMQDLYAAINASITCGEEIDLSRLFKAFTTETFVAVGVGVDMKCIGRTAPHPFLDGCDVATRATSRRFRRPKWYWKAQRLLRIGYERELQDSMAGVRAWLHESIQRSLELAMSKRRASKSEQAGPASHSVKSMVELFVESRDELEEKDLVDFMLTFVLAARDTTAVALDWMFYALSKHPDVAARVRQEMESQLVPELACDTYLTMDHISRLTYLEAVIKETLRLYPPAPFTMRQVAQDVVICDDILLRKGQIAVTPAYVVARNPDVWGPDASKFRPERWLDAATGQLKHVTSTEFFTFSAGPRVCIGKALALLELRVVAANLLARYHFDVSPQNDGSYCSNGVGVSWWVAESLGT
ncbi:hypothetical protein P43SY_003485 [Pythium insidiosum]|uniref:Cytochrome P450 n=1 Tax=Pythium insidiosum TaxID=114742 RepID=A0AAD5Q8C2_PYTIN|nr:hypothetical protein P43SY_003485 [Pythium insidiosum]